ASSKAPLKPARGSASHQSSTRSAVVSHSNSNGPHGGQISVSSFRFRPKRSTREERELEKIQNTRKRIEQTQSEAWEEWKQDWLKTWTTLGTPLYIRYGRRL